MFVPALFWLLLPAIAITGLVFALRGRRSRIRAVAVAEALAVASTTCMLVIYVASEDSYRNDGTSRWDAYDAKGLTSAAVACGVVAFALLAAARRAKWADARIAGFLSATAAAVMQFIAVVANSAN